MTAYPFQPRPGIAAVDPSVHQTLSTLVGSSPQQIEEYRHKLARTAAKFDTEHQELRVLTAELKVAMAEGKVADAGATKFLASVENFQQSLGPVSEAVWNLDRAALAIKQAQLSVDSTHPLDKEALALQCNPYLHAAGRALGAVGATYLKASDSVTQKDLGQNGTDLLTKAGTVAGLLSSLNGMKDSLFKEKEKEVDTSAYDLYTPPTGLAGSTAYAGTGGTYASGEYGGGQATSGYPGAYGSSSYPGSTSATATADPTSGYSMTGQSGTSHLTGLGESASGGSGYGSGTSDLSGTGDGAANVATAENVGASDGIGSGGGGSGTGSGDGSDGAGGANSPTTQSGQESGNTSVTVDGSGRLDFEPSDEQGQIVAQASPDGSGAGAVSVDRN